MTTLAEAMKWASSPLAAGGHERALLDEVIRLRSCLQAIADRHTPDQPADSGSEVAYLQECYMQLRRMALSALTVPEIAATVLPAGEG